ncbi:MAG: hypothetical protein IKA41_05330, partial [Bacteroidaceae bacterium]|nr:hypothetical protein [Bacteroidaceae bacterium]
MKIVASILKSNPFSTNSREVQLPWLYAVALILSVWLIADVNVQYANDSLHYMRAGELFLNGHSVEHIIHRTYQLMQRMHLHYVIEFDIKGFFDNVDHSKLIRQLW